MNDLKIFKKKTSYFYTLLGDTQKSSENTPDIFSNNNLHLDKQFREYNIGFQ